MEQLLTAESMQTARTRLRQVAIGDAIGGRNEYRMVKKDGREAIVELAVRLITANDRPVAIQTIARNITEEKVAAGEYAVLHRRDHQGPGGRAQAHCS